ncbi:S-adenosyl-L-methionine-dependent methyltransferase [Violaceomyces palustris]|uniref:S-adenosyl-L-methionine-dependent methyltransferase n=1 Tax=Violaceomyces palustris TaxID=1673888 RepID=A0ACD0NQN2_9BASI|nr:S-adenosyl-L-methionine-dependent methyltransferase [Violaceomyces palustris]
MSSTQSLQQAYQKKRAYNHQDRVRRRSFPFTCLTNLVKESLIHDYVVKPNLLVAATKPSRILDLGCGRGADFNRFERALPGILYTGIDMSSNMLTQSPFQNHPRVRLLLLSHENTEMPPADVIWSFLGMQNACGTTEKMNEVLRRAWDCLSDGGVFLGAIPHGTKIIHDLERLCDPSQPFCFERTTNRFADEQWYTFTLEDAYEKLPEAAISPTTLQECAEQIGFGVEMFSFSEYIARSGQDPSKRHIRQKLLDHVKHADWATHLAAYYMCFALKKPRSLEPKKGWSSSKGLL